MASTADAQAKNVAAAQAKRPKAMSATADDQRTDAIMKSAVEEVQETWAADDFEGPEGEIVDLEAEDKSPVIKLVNSMLRKAVEMKASDIHIEPFEDEVRVRFRVDGVLMKILSFPKRAATAVVSRIKIMSRMDIAEKRIPQDGRMKTKFSEDVSIDYRVNTLPGVYGEKVVIRILGQAELRNGIEDLGFRGEAKRSVIEAIQNPYGMILVTGPTGSGKTTTLYTILQQLNTEDVNIVTAEDPVEYRLKGITQVNIRSNIGFTFDVALRAFLRQDPDIVLVGEMRDFETAAIAVKAALTGHLVLSTLHTNDCASTVVRLVDMGIEPYMVASAVKLVIAQRLVRRICTECKEEIPVREAERKEIDEAALEEIEHLYKGRGCRKCNGLGYKGRAPVFELMPIKSTELKKIITEAGTEVQISQVARKEGIRTLRDCAIEMVNEGLTTIDETIGIIMSTT